MSKLKADQHRNAKAREREKEKEKEKEREDFVKIEARKANSGPKKHSKKASADQRKRMNESGVGRTGRAGDRSGPSLDTQ